MDNLLVSKVLVIFFFTLIKYVNEVGHKAFCLYVFQLKENIAAEVQGKRSEEDELAKDYGDEKDISSLDTEDLMDDW